MQKIVYYNSPIGLMEIVGEQDFISRVKFAKQITNETPDWETGKRCAVQLDEYFAGKRQEFNLPLRPQGTDFQLSVWQALQEIPFGKTLSYGEMARKIGNPKACRAVGGANNRNPISIIIPCHRVVGANGSLTGYASGLDRKEFLLNLEKSQ
ncbi:MAG: methylated-DNA--[protein]-cysteine S-methyltransferase [Prevotellaceae bacterium]|jgi:methylated-DNA-[protein]-cysteine S-methyltransferase|nr:methylated-DNA--[protein]-cysteine S-methyltransferase [Prevotellaceae bacterium]